jgi:hypothetical protein
VELFTLPVDSITESLLLAELLEFLVAVQQTLTFLLLPVAVEQVLTVLAVAVQVDFECLPHNLIQAIRLLQ